jgi:hypothetical protein
MTSDLSKTAEELAEEYANKHTCGDHDWGGAYGGFLAGYQAAKDQLSKYSNCRIKLFKNDDDAKAAQNDTPKTREIL